MSGETETPAPKIFYMYTTRLNCLEHRLTRSKKTGIKLQNRNFLKMRFAQSRRQLLCISRRCQTTSEERAEQPQAVLLSRKGYENSVTRDYKLYLAASAFRPSRIYS